MKETELYLSNLSTQWPVSGKLGLIPMVHSAQRSSSFIRNDGLSNSGLDIGNDSCLKNTPREGRREVKRRRCGGGGSARAWSSTTVVSIAITAITVFRIPSPPSPSSSSSSSSSASSCKNTLVVTSAGCTKPKVSTEFSLSQTCTRTSKDEVNTLTNQQFGASVAYPPRKQKTTSGTRAV